MTTTRAVNGSVIASPPHTDWLALARELGPGFAARAAAHDANDSFPEENYRELKAHRFFSAGVPVALGGGGASSAGSCPRLAGRTYAAARKALRPLR
jgi:alkylation response protein AidB-like acyl-CoA dehydrogenase